MSKKQSNSKNNFSYRGRDVSFVVLLLVSLAAFFNILVLSLNYSSGTEEQAVITAETYSDDAKTAFVTRLNSLREKTRSIAVASAAYTDIIKLNDFLYNCTQTEGFAEENITDIRYFLNDGSEHNYRDSVFTEENPYVLDMRDKNVLATYGIIFSSTEFPSLACYCPVPKNTDNTQLITGIVIFFPQSTVLNFTDVLNEEKQSASVFQALCYIKDNRPTIFAKLYDKSNQVQENTPFDDYLRSISNGGANATEINAAIALGTSGIVKTYIQNELYIVSVGAANETDTGLYLVSLYNAADVYAQGYEMVVSIITTMAILGIVFLTFVIYFIVSRQKLRKRIVEINMINPTLKCPTLIKYEKDAKDILARNRGTNFAVIISHVHHFNYITETFGDATTTNMLLSIKETFASAIMIEETYGYVQNGEFVLLLHFKEKERLENRLVSLYAIIKRSSETILNGYDLKMCYGIYEAPAGSEELIQRMVEKAMVVRNLPSRSDVNQICHFYNETVRSDYLIRAEIEGRMENALASGEFRVFYQPKYNLERDYIDGAELLVRWYDPNIKKYRKPNEFLPVFESNGFISKLDRHIYYTACETLFDRISKGKKIFPISVNVSRVTAIQPDFLTYYIKVKQHFNIADGFITLEFTESFAYENYEYLSTIAKELRKAGFLCSIDDFGTGYSSYNILKILEMDEIKMDRFFLDQGSSPERDRIIIESVIDISKKMGVKVTQEGVETLEQLKLLRSLGCKVIQGYYFAKPMSLGDYDKFIDDFFVANKILVALEDDKKTHPSDNANSAATDGN